MDKALMDFACSVLDSVQEAMSDMVARGGDCFPVPVAVFAHTMQGHMLSTQIDPTIDVAEMLTLFVHEAVVHLGVQVAWWVLVADSWYEHYDESGVERPATASEALVVTVMEAGSTDVLINQPYARVGHALFFQERHFIHGPAIGSLPSILREAFSYLN